MKSKQIILAFLGLLFVNSALSNATASTRYIVTDLGEGVAWDINNNGQVVGTYSPSGGYGAFLWDSSVGRQEILGVLFFGNNDLGQIVGHSYSDDPGFVYDSNTETWSEIDLLNGSGTLPNAINNLGQVAGHTGDQIIFIWDIANSTQPIGFSGWGNDVNDLSQVVGKKASDSEAFIWDNVNGVQNIPSLSGNEAEAYGVNNIGQVVGTSRSSLTTVESHAFLWDEINGIQDLGTLGYRLVGSDDSVAFDVNISGEIVGRSNSPSSTDNTIGWNGWVAFIWNETRGMRDLSLLIPPDTGWVLGTAYAINDQGQIVGCGGFNEEEHAFLLTPIPINQPILFGWKYPGGLMYINTVTGESSLIMPSDRQIEALAFDTLNRVLFGVENLAEDNMLVEIDFEANTISNIGPVVGFTEITAMTYDETTNRIFALDQTTRTLLVLDPSTGETTTIGNFSHGASNGLASQPTTGDLFASVYVDPGYLARIDKSTGASTLIGPFGPGDSAHVRGLSFHPETGVLFGNAGGTGPFADGRLVTIDSTTGLASPIGDPSGAITALTFIELLEAKIEVEIDIKPGSGPNSINLRSKGVIPVAVMTTDDFDAGEIDPNSCLFAGSEPERWRMEDVDNDGDWDIVFHCRTQELELDANSTQATLTGLTIDGMEIMGTDSVRIVPRGKNK